jgi:hypothetical protein
MSHIKRAYFAGERDGEPLVHVIRPGEAVKTASYMLPSVQSFIDRLTPDPRYTYVLVNAMGYSEFYGANSNRDYYGYNLPLDFNGLLHMPPGFGGDYETDRMQGKAWPYGFPTYYGATVYAHHKNTDPQQLGFGDVVFVAANPVMKRIELVKRVFNEEAHKKGHTSILNRIYAGERVDVSMGCFKAGAMVTMADGTRKPIEQIEVGDRVRTHTGDTGRVTELHRRKYRGEFFEIKPANEDAFVATVEHPFWAAFEAKDARRVWKADKPTFDWVYARDLEGAVLSRPKITRTESTDVTPQMARILGYYLAEGHVVLDKKGAYAGIELTVNKSDAVNREIADLCAAVGSKNDPVWRQRENSEESFAIGIYDPKLAELCVDLCGRFSKTKKLAEEVLYWSDELQFNLLGAYFNGDGFSADGDLLCSTASAGLAQQVREILFRLGIPTSYQLLHHKAGSGKSKEDTFEWVTSIGKQWAGRFVPYCAKASCTDILKTKNVYKDYGDLWAVPVREYSSFYGEDDVYNFEVEGDNSYLVNGVAAHNCKVPFDFCSICTDWDAVKTAWKTFDPKQHAHPGIAILHYHKKAKPIRGLAITRRDYCEHMLQMPGKILPDGRKVFVYNDFPRFFDISFVWIGADRTARVMWHLGTSSSKGALSAPAKDHTLSRLLDVLLSRTTASKLAAMEKEIPDGIAQAVEHDAKTTPDMSGLFTQLSGSEETAKKLFTALGALGIVPTPREFQTVVLTAMGPSWEKVSALLAEKNATFDPSCGGLDDTYAVDPALYDQKLASSLVPLMPERSSFAPFLMPRLAEPEEKTASDDPTLLTGEDGDVMQQLAAQYNGLRISLFEQAPDLMPKSAAFLGPDVYLREKDAGIGSAALLLGLAPVISLLSSHLNRRREEGQQLGTMAQLVADNPTYASMVTIGAGLRAAMLISEAGGLGAAAKSVVTAVRKVI